MHSKGFPCIHLLKRSDPWKIATTASKNDRSYRYSVMESIRNELPWFVGRDFQMHVGLEKVSTFQYRVDTRGTRSACLVLKSLWIEDFLQSSKPQMFMTCMSPCTFLISKTLDLERNMDMKRRRKVAFWGTIRKWWSITLAGKHAYERGLIRLHTPSYVSMWISAKA